MAIRTKFYHKSDVFKRLYLKEKDVKQKKRFQAMYLLSKNYQVQNVCDIVGVTRRMINLWVCAYAKNGLKGLLIKEYKGAKPKIDAVLREDLVKIIKTPPRKIGFNFSSWNTKTLKLWFREVYNMEVTRPRIFQILKEENFSWKKGEHVYVLADEKEQKRFIRKVRKIFQKLTPSQIALFQDECSVRQHPTLTHMWMKTGTTIEVPTYGNHKKNEFLAQ